MSSWTCLFSFIGNGELHEFESEQVVHVHALGPALLVTNLGFVLQVANDLRLARQGPKIKKHLHYYPSTYHTKKTNTKYILNSSATNVFYFEIQFFYFWRLLNILTDFKNVNKKLRL
jgi:hypothetical protein